MRVPKPMPYYCSEQFEEWYLKGEKFIKDIDFSSEGTVKNVLAEAWNDAIWTYKNTRATQNGIAKCSICNKELNVTMGSDLPICCGSQMKENI